MSASIESQLAQLRVKRHRLTGDSEPHCGAARDQAGHVVDPRAAPRAMLSSLRNRLSRPSARGQRAGRRLSSLALTPSRATLDLNRPESELLLACVSADPAAGARIERILGGDLDWTSLVRAALDHGVSPLVADRLLRTRAGLIPDDLRRALAEHLADNRDRIGVLVAALFELLDTLGDHGVTAVPFKGPALAAAALGDPSLRRAGDLDLLVRREDVETTWSVLEALGYREVTEFEIGRRMNAAERRGHFRYQCECAFVRERDRAMIEPHWAITPAMLAVDLDYAQLWRRIGAIEMAGRRVPALALEDLLLVLCIHGSKHEWTRLQWIADVAVLIGRCPQLDLPLVLAQARARGTLRMTLLGLGLARHVLGTPMPDVVNRALAQDRCAARLVSHFAVRLFAGRLEAPSPAQFSRWRSAMRERCTDRARYAVRTVLTPTARHYRLCALPASLAWLYVPIKLAHDYLALPAWRWWSSSRRASS